MIKYSGKVKMKDYQKESRTLTYVDLENACGGSAHVAHRHGRVLHAIQGLSDGRPMMIVYSTGVRAANACKDLYWKWGGCRFLLGRGLNGADNALIEALENEPCAFRSDRVILVSGDHAFTPSVKRLRERGIHVTVVSPPSSLSSELREAASEIAWLPIEDSLVEYTDLHTMEKP
jgi:hypothetical protein